MDPRPHNPIRSRNNFIWVELSGPRSLQAINALCLDLHNLFVLLFWKGQETYGKKLETAAERKFIIRGLRNKVVLDMGP